jgi:hypothetical protein
MVAVDEEVNLTLTDVVLHVTVGTVDPLVKISSLAFDLRERGHDEARIVPAAGMLGLSDDSAKAAPT